jgi:hypothetical protein
MWHMQDCCEDVKIEDIVGDLDEIGTPITMAEEITERRVTGDSVTWTFYKLLRIKVS